MGIVVQCQYFSTRQSKVDFPHFNRDDLNGWLYRCQQFFEFDGTSPEAKVKLAAINMEERQLDPIQEVDGQSNLGSICSSFGVSVWGHESWRSNGKAT